MFFLFSSDFIIFVHNYVFTLFQNFFSAYISPNSLLVFFIYGNWSKGHFVGFALGPAVRVDNLPFLFLTFLDHLDTPALMLGQAYGDLLLLARRILSLARIVECVLY